MAEYLHPGVFVEETSSGVRPIEGVGTSTAAFIGVTAKGVPNKATFITSWAQFVRKFGYLIPSSYLPYAVSQFFNNGGKRCYIVRALNVVSSKSATFDIGDRETMNTPPVANARPTLRVTANGAGKWGNGLLVTVQDATNSPTSEFKLIIAQDDPANVVELFDSLSMDPTSDDYVETAINGVSDYITVKDLSAAAVMANAKATTGVLVNPVPFGADTLIATAQDGSSLTANLAGNLTPSAAAAAITTAFAGLNISASIDSTGRMVVMHNSAGFDKYFTLTGTAIAGGKLSFGAAPIFAQGTGAAIGATLKSSLGPFNIPVGPGNVLTITVHGNALPAINLPTGAAVTASDVMSAINSALATTGGGMVSASVENNHVVLATANKGGSADNTIATSGTAAAVLNFASITGTANAATGMGRNEFGFVQSGLGPFAFPNDPASPNSVFNLHFNSNAPATPTVSVPVTINASMPGVNLAQVTADQIATAINTATSGAGLGNLASVVSNRVVVRSVFRGNFYSVQVEDSTNSPNIRLKFETAAKIGFAEGDAASPFVRPSPKFVSGVIQPWPLQNGDDGPAVSDTDYIGNGDLKTGLHALDDVTDVNFVAIPGITTPGVISQGVGYCTIRRDCFFIADSPGKFSKDAPVTDPSHVADFLSNKITTKTSYGGFYYPWMLVSDEVGAGKNPTRYVPPSGFVAGMYARIDNTRGVWKAPAGTEAGVIGPLDLEYSVTDSEQDILNPIGVNCIRHFPASGIVIWGARTMGTLSDPEWRYIPVRRYAMYLEVSIYRGTQWAVFEPNDTRLWASLKANIEDFLMGEFRKGALAGTSPQQAFEVKCDADLNPDSEVNAGRVNMEVKFAPLKPAEFVIIRISQKVQRPGA